jgi:hypothetical protein
MWMRQSSDPLRMSNALWESDPAGLSGNACGLRSIIRYPRRGFMSAARHIAIWESSIG